MVIKYEKFIQNYSCSKLNKMEMSNPFSTFGCQNIAANSKFPIVVVNWEATIAVVNSSRLALWNSTLNFATQYATPALPALRQPF
jgi:hypothetical protein